MVTIQKGNILDSPEEYMIIQQVNCMGKMGKGVALSIAQKYPYVKEQYVDFCNGKICYGGGNISPSPEELLGDVYVARHPVHFERLVACVFGQLSYKRYWEPKDTRHTDYEALEKGLTTLARAYAESGLHFAIPYKMGCVNGGGDWETVYKMIERILGSSFDVTIYKYDQYQ